MERVKKSSEEVIPGEKKGTIALPPVFLKQLGVVPSTRAAVTPDLFRGELQEQGAPQGRPGEFKRLSRLIQNRRALIPLRACSPVVSG